MYIASSKGKKRPVRVVLDTNVIISGFLTPGNSRNILALAAQRAIFVFSSPILEKELADVLRDKLKHGSATISHELLTYRELVHELVYPKVKLDIIPNDPVDNRILETAVEAKSDLIITGDKHLLTLGKYRHIKIIKPSDFLLQYLSK